MGGFFFDFEVIRTASSDRDAPAQVIATLQVQADVDPALTCLVWSKLEEANPDFFLSYDVRLKLKDQIVAFNYLVEQQTRLLQKLTLALPQQGLMD